MSIKKCWYIMMTFLMLVTLTSCANMRKSEIVLKRPTGLSCSAPTYDNGATIRWNAVPSATGYIIFIDDVEVARADKNVYAFPYEDSEKFCGKNCTVQAYNKRGVSLVSNILIIPEKVPITVQKIRFYYNVTKNPDNTLLLEWQNVGAIKYEIYIDSEKISETEDTEFLLSAQEVFNNNGKKISVKVIEDNVKIDYLNYEYEISSNVLIEAPLIQESHDEEGNFVISWEPVEGAVSYRVYVDGAQYVYDLTELHYVFNGSTNFSGSEISVRAVDIYDRTSVFSNYCIYKTSLIKPILEVTNLENGDVLVKWNKVKYADHYKLYWRNERVSKEYTVIDLKETEYIFSKEKFLKDADRFEIYVEATDRKEENIEDSEHYYWKK